MKVLIAILIEIVLGVLLGLGGCYVIWLLGKKKLSYWEVLSKYGFTVGSVLCIVFSILIIIIIS